jgi:hypothetical protein
MTGAYEKKAVPLEEDGLLPACREVSRASRLFCLLPVRYL